MKKILAIALAVAMVLSMASASAFFCDGINWAENTNTIKCGKATIEVVELVRSNALCGFEFAESGCAAVVAGENIYFGIKLTVPADVNPEWWADTTAALKGVNTKLTADDTWFPLGAVNAKDEGTYWLTQETALKDAQDITAAADVDTTTWTKVSASSAFGVKNVFAVKADKANAKVCARLFTDVFDGHDEDIKVGDYTVQFTEGEITAKVPTKTTDTKALAAFTVTNGTYAATMLLDKADGKVVAIYVDKADTTAIIAAADADRVYVGYVGEKFSYVDATTVSGYATEDMTCGESKFVKDIMGVFGFDFGTTTTYKVVKKTFGFGGEDDVVSDCSSYKVGTSAIVDAACEIDIPKTGDVSVIAYAVMAIVAAAGAMGLKK